MTADTIEIVESAAELARRSQRTFEILLAFAKIPNRPVAEQTAGWMSNVAVARWLRYNGSATSGNPQWRRLQVHDRRP
jgi:hypothetical protein